MLWIVIISILVLLFVVFGILAFKNGYQFPDKDKHPDWPMFPKSSNADISITPVEGLYVSNLQSIPGSTDYMVFYASDSASFYDRNVGTFRQFGIVNNKGEFKKKFDQNILVFYTDRQIVIAPSDFGNNNTDTCQIYDISTGALSKQIIKTLKLSGIDEFAGDTAAYIKKYQTDFFKSLRGVRWFEEDATPAGDASRYRGYMLYTDAKGNFYPIKPSAELRLLCADCESYQLETSAFLERISGDKITTASAPTLCDNDIKFGYRLGMGNPNGKGGGFYFFVNHTWLHYYTARVGKELTSFKVKGPEKNEAYTKFYQLNNPETEEEPLVFVADRHVWRVSKKQVYN